MCEHLHGGKTKNNENKIKLNCNLLVDRLYKMNTFIIFCNYMSNEHAWMFVCARPHQKMLHFFLLTFDDIRQNVTWVYAMGFLFDFS